MQNRIIYTIGHSNQDIKTFIWLLKENSLEVVVDVRSNPYSKYASQFNKKCIRESICNNGMKYLFMGGEIGGKPDDMQFYDSQGYVLYSRIAQSPRFIKGIDRLLEGIKQYRIVLACSEENPVTCHRRLLIGRVLSDRGVDMLHIRNDGRIQSEEGILREYNKLIKNDVQQTLFKQDIDVHWKSVRPVLKQA